MSERNLVAHAHPLEAFHRRYVQPVVSRGHVRSPGDRHGRPLSAALLPDSPAPHPPLLTTLQSVLASSPTPLTRRDLLERWPGAAPRHDTLWRTLARGLELGLFVKSGTGTKTDAFRFRLRTTPTESNAGEHHDPGLT